MRTIRIGTRGSQLALWQANFVEGKLREKHPEKKFQQVIIKTEGDADQKSSLTQIGGQGVFTKAIEDALLNNTIDIAVHSLKDLPSAMPNGLELGAVPQRVDVEDVLVTPDGITLSDLPAKARVATGSLRRRSQLLHLRPDLELQDLRGNIDTRLRKLHEQDLSAIIMAKAAIFRLQLSDVKYYTFPVTEMVPGVGQGAVGVQIRSDDSFVKDLAASINIEEIRIAVTAERSFLNELDSGCQFPIGAYAQIKNGSIVIDGFVGSIDGKTIIRESAQGEINSADKLGRSLARKFIDRGAINILNQSTNG